MPSGIITTYLSLRLLVRRGFLDIYPTFRQKSTNFRVADYRATNRRYRYSAHFSDYNDAHA
jgi:hypothetical protein